MIGQRQTSKIQVVSHSLWQFFHFLNTVCFFLYWMSLLHLGESAHCFFFTVQLHDIFLVSFENKSEECQKYVHDGSWVFESKINTKNICSQHLSVFRCGRWSRRLARLWRGPITVFRYADEDMWEAGEGRTLCSQQPCGSPDDQLLWAAAEQSATAGWVKPPETQDFSVQREPCPLNFILKAH